MSTHPINLAVRVLLELSILVTLGAWGWQRGPGGWGIALAVGLPFLAAALWATFRVPDDPGAAPVPIPGVLRLILELGLFALAVWALYELGAPTRALILGILIVLHYAVSYDRIAWLTKP